ncbi:hypothetical protein [Neolewinella persica]|uniref:hypothetical protein n=1 Tax=Neolewinella persica TaxID=70998 RepID=UPI0012FB550A|nr:hypothetical protein [Neolewinella persica]
MNHVDLTTTSEGFARRPRREGRPDSSAEGRLRDPISRRTSQLLRRASADERSSDCPSLAQEKGDPSVSISKLDESM